MNKIKKLTILASSVLLTSMVTTTVFGWFYFPNAKGLEMDTAPSLDLDVKLYESNGTSFTQLTPTSYRLATSNDFDNGFISGINYYTLVETEASAYNSSLEYYVKSATAYTKLGTITEDVYNSYNTLYTLVATEAETYQTNTTYYIPSYSIEAKYEFFQWGDEYICEDLDTVKYYALECICDSEAYIDGYIQSVLNLKLDCLGAFLYDTNQVANASIPVFELSYAYASESSMDLSLASALSEAKNTTYTKLINGNYYTLSGQNYVVASTYSSGNTYYTMDVTGFFVKDSTAWSNGGYASKGLYYYNAGTYIPTTTYQTGVYDYYELSNITVAESVRSFGTNGNNFTTIDGVANASNYQITNSVEMACFKTNLLDTQYVHSSDANHETSYVRFIVFLKVEPDEDYITSYMSANSAYTTEAVNTEILISNSLSMDLTLRSVPKYTSYPTE